MNRRPFYETTVPEVGLGCWQLGGDWGQMSDAQAAEILQVAYEAGCRLFDTAEGYGGGRSERRIGAFLRSLPPKAERPLVATKISSNRATGEGDAFSVAGMREATEGSLRRLGVEAIDLTQLHCMSKPKLLNDKVWQALRDLRDEGLVRHVGASVETVEEGRLAIERGAQSLQIIFNMFRQRPLTEGLLDQAQADGVAILVRLPLASGLLSGKFTHETRFDETDHRHYNRDGDAFNVGETLGGLTLDDGVDLVDQFTDVVDLPENQPLAHTALRWVLDHRQVTAVIPGATRVEQVRSNVAAATCSPLSVECHAAIHRFWKQHVDPKVRGPQ